MRKKQNHVSQLSVVYVYFTVNLHTALIYMNPQKHTQTQVLSRLKVTEMVSGDYALMRRSAFSGM